MVPRFFAAHSFMRPILAAAFLLAIGGAGGGVNAWAQAPDQDEPEFSVQAPRASTSLLLDVTSIDGLVVAVGARGHILLSEDQGQTWKQVAVPTRSGLNAVFFFNRNLGWAVGHDSVILRTKDAGVTWERVHWAPEEENPLMDVWFKNANEGYAIGAYGAFFETFDGGATWASRSISEDDYHLNQIASGGGDRLYIAAEAGFLYRSDDGGETWTDLPSPYDGSFFGVLPLAYDQVLAFGLRGHLFWSDDAGETWTKIETNTLSMLTNACLMADKTIIITGLGGVVLVSHDSGHTFNLHQQPDRRGISAVEEAANDTLVFVGEFGVKTLPLSEFESRKDE